MQSLSILRPSIWLVVLMSLAAGAALIVSAPLAERNILYLFASPAIFAVLVLSIFRPETVLALVLFTRVLLDPVLNQTKMGWMGADFGLGAFINLLIIFLAAVLIARKPDVIRQYTAWKAWAFYLFICLIAIFTSPVKIQAMKLFLNLFTYFCMAAIPFALIQNSREKSGWLRLLLWTTALPVLYAHFDLLRGGRFYEEGLMRITGTFSHPNILGFYLLFVIVLVFNALKNPTRPYGIISRNLLRLYLLDVIVLLIATKSRNAWLGAWLFFLFYGLFRNRKYFFLCLAAPIIFAFIPPVADRIQDLFQNTGGTLRSDLNSFAWRWELWKRAWEHIWQNPVLGYGLASFKPLSVNFFPTYVGVAPHNTWIETLFESGVVGLTAFVTVFLFIFKDLWKGMTRWVGQNSNECALAAAYFISYFISCAADNMLYYLAFNWYFLFFIGVILKSSKTQEAL
ncbi:MAG: O-antigen ligase family protein [Candidatus Omnitrophica bacterium]|nr:O-antigen ligase family protein [Candidatus Omnitrophota bacterium]